MLEGGGKKVADDGDPLSNLCTTTDGDVSSFVSPSAFFNDGGVRRRRERRAMEEGCGCYGGVKVEGDRRRWNVEGRWCWPTKVVVVNGDCGMKWG